MEKYVDRKIHTLESGINIPLWIFFQGLQSYYRLKRIKFYYISFHILRGYVYSFCQILQRLRLFKGLRLFQTLEYYWTRRCSTICKEFGFTRSTDNSKVYNSSFQRALSFEKYWSFRGLWIECSENFKFIVIPRNTDVSEVYESIISGHYLPKFARVERIQAPCQAKLF